MKRASRAALLSAAAGEEELLYEVTWRAAADPGGPAEVRAAPGRWVVCGGGARDGVAADVVRGLEAQGQTVVLADGGGEGARVVDPSRRESWRGLFEGLPDAVPLRGVVHLAGLGGHGDGATGRELGEDVERNVGSALALAQGLQDSGLRPTSGLWLVTSGGQVVGEEPSGQLSGAVLWGFGRAAALELPDVRVGLVDVDPAAPESVEPLVVELLFPDGETEVAWRSGRRLVSRLVRRAAGAGRGSGSGGVRGDRSYLVTGGFGGIGLRVAGWLADGGAGAIVLNGGVGRTARRRG